jgi:hypothetical protein
VLATAQALLANGGAMAPVGTHIAAMAARRHSVPFVVLCGIYKLATLFPHNPCAAGLGRAWWQLPLLCRCRVQCSPHVPFLPPFMPFPKPYSLSHHPALQKSTSPSLHTPAYAPVCRTRSLSSPPHTRIHTLATLTTVLHHHLPPFPCRAAVTFNDFKDPADILPYTHPAVGLPDKAKAEAFNRMVSGKCLCEFLLVAV